MSIETLPKVGDRIKSSWTGAIYPVLEVDEVGHRVRLGSPTNSTLSSFGWLDNSGPAWRDWEVLPGAAPRFRVGDKVRVAEDSPWHDNPGDYVAPEYHGAVGWLSAELAPGRWQVTLTPGSYQHNVINEACLTLIEEPATPELRFKPGDRVHVGDDPNSSPDFKNVDAEVVVFYADDLWEVLLSYGNHPHEATVTEVYAGGAFGYEPTDVGAGYTGNTNANGWNGAKMHLVRRPGAEVQPSVEPEPIDWEKKYEDLKVRVAKVAREYGIKNDWCSEVERALKELEIEPHQPRYKGTVTITYEVDAVTTAHREDVGSDAAAFLKRSIVGAHDVKLDSDWAEGGLKFKAADVSLEEEK